MLLRLVMPAIIGLETRIRVECVFLSVGDRLVPGRKLFDLSIDLSDSFGQDCPPISHYRLVARETATVRKIQVAAGEQRAPGEVIALLSVTPDEALDGETARPMRLTTAGILGHTEMWSLRPAS